MRQNLFFTSLLSTLLAAPTTNALPGFFFPDPEAQPPAQEELKRSEPSHTARMASTDRSARWRPQIHFSPPSNWMNDPNGLFIDSDGVWHMYYQYADNVPGGGAKHWGHTTATDFYNWVDHPIGIPASARDGSIWSGSVVIDKENVSGFFPSNKTNGKDNIIAYYTSWEPDQQSQHIAWSYDGGETFNQYESNPIISLNRHGFRDPKISFHHETKTWVMVLSLENQVTFYTSTDLVKWTQVSYWNPQRNIGMIECPQFLQIPLKDKSGKPVGSKWVLTLSLGGGSPTGGAEVKYLTGSWDGTHFTPDGPVSGRSARNTIHARQDTYAIHDFDFGPDNYATAFFHFQDLDDANHDAYSVTWAVDASSYGCCTPTDREGWRHCMGGVRRHWLDANTNKLVSVPAGDLSKLASTTPGWNPIIDEKNVAGIEGTSSVIRDFDPAVEWTLTVRMARSLLQEGSTASAELSFQGSQSNGAEKVSLGFQFTGSAGSAAPVASFNIARASTTWDRSGSYGISDVQALEAASEEGSDANIEFHLHGIIDRSILEVYVNGGVEAGTMLYFTDKPLDSIILTRGGSNAQGITFDFKATALKSSWGAYEEKAPAKDEWITEEL
ncbi:beta-fructofuranosidase [Colletotrichum truncatum]|uniref:Beta-fructofuranosidase n=1 Tax=Colletotrichum truncatum TaxID=5467 RepID=A0ACC3Z638_COLTU|nr:beta-fructofuranosidase [Colletotrichum truncatum]KAF6787141.1 beta-fructofuranosidase [Colletotrichum truncatum]